MLLNSLIITVLAERSVLNDEQFVTFWQKYIIFLDLFPFLEKWPSLPSIYAYSFSFPVRNMVQHGKVSRFKSLCVFDSIQVFENSLLFEILSCVYAIDFHCIYHTFFCTRDLRLKRNAKTLNIRTANYSVNKIRWNSWYHSHSKNNQIHCTVQGLDGLTLVTLYFRRHR